jgi:hypothetical protein
LTFNLKQIRIGFEEMIAMEYFNSILENAIVEVVERQADEIHLNIKYEELEKSMQSQSIELLREILNYIEESKDTNDIKIGKIEKLLLDSGIHR